MSDRYLVLLGYSRVAEGVGLARVARLLMEGRYLILSDMREGFRKGAEVGHGDLSPVYVGSMRVASSKSAARCWNPRGNLSIIEIGLPGFTFVITELISMHSWCAVCLRPRSGGRFGSWSVVIAVCV